MNEIKLLETQIEYYKSKSQLDIEVTKKELNERINKLVDKVNNLNIEVNNLHKLLDIKNHVIDKSVYPREEFDYTNR